jgi:hypothetical protein
MHVSERLLAASCLIVAAFLGCSNNPFNQTAAKGDVSINLVADAASDFAATAKTAEVKVSADGMPTLTKALTVTATGISGTVTGIIAGLNRKFEVFVYDASSKLCYYGSAVGEVTVGGTANISLTLYKTNGEGNAIINGTIQSTNTPPTVSMTSPANNATFTAGAAITLTATASDADGTVRKVAFYSGATLLSIDSVAPYTYNYSASTAGTYTFSAVATDNAGASTTSASVSVTVTAANQTSYKINCGGSAASPFIADQNFSGGTAHTVTNAITTTGVANAAPQAVYQSERYGTTTYTFPNLTTGAQYTVRLHFAELYQTAAGKRKFNVDINGASVLSSFDIYATAGARYKAVVREFTATPNASKQIVIKFTTVTDNATICGIEIIPAIAAPVITTDLPSAKSVYAGQPVTFSIVASGSNLNYQWYRSGYGSYAITGATSSTYIIPSADQFSSGDNPNYRCMVWNAADTVWSGICQLTVRNPVTITTNLPATKSVNVGQPVTFAIVASGASLNYQWYRSGYGSYAITGATSSTYTIASADQFSSGDNPNYSCKVWNSTDTVWSGTCQLTVLPAIVITTDLPSTKTVNVGQSVTFSIVASGIGLNYQWYRSGYGSYAITGATSSTYSIASADQFSSGDNPNYRCMVWNSADTLWSGTCQLTVNQ